MRLLGKLGSYSVEILMDLGSTHNFLNPLVVEVAKLKIERDSNLQVKVANGDKILNQEKCKEVIKIQGTKFLVPFHVLTLWGCDIVLGVQWLKTLGLINWDFTNMTAVKEGNLTLQSLNSECVEVETTSKQLKFFFCKEKCLAAVVSDSGGTKRRHCSAD